MLIFMLRYQVSVYRTICPLVKDLLLRNCLANQSKILCRASMDRGNESLFAASGSHDQDGSHAHTLKALGIFFPDSRYWLSIFFRFCTKSVLLYGAHCMSKSILGLKRTILVQNRCNSHQKHQKPDQIR